MNIKSILDRYEVPYEEAGHRHVRDGWLGVDCPDCDGNGGRYHLGINLRSSYATCWRCGPRRLGDVLSALTGEPPAVCLGWLDGLDRTRRRPVDEGRRKGRVKLPSGLEPLRGPHRRYLRARGFDPDEVARLWGVKGIGLAARLAWRLWIPIRLDGETVSWTTRAIGKVPKRYINAGVDEEALPAKTLLYGGDYARQAVVVCEGPTDAWRIGPGAVAVMGLGYSRAQLLALCRYPVRAVVFDREPAAQRRATRLANELQAYPGETTVVELESGEDVADADPDEVRAIRSAFLGDRGVE